MTTFYLLYGFCIGASILPLIGLVVFLAIAYIGGVADETDEQSGTFISDIRP
mgnify:CR=1 FL=1